MFVVVLQSYAQSHLKKVIHSVENMLKNNIFELDFEPICLQGCFGLSRGIRYGSVKLGLTGCINMIRVIPQGTVDNNLGQDRLAGPKTLDTNYCRQPTL